MMLARVTSLFPLWAILATPLLTWLYVGERVSVPVQGMLWSIFKIVLLPVSLGVLANSLAGRIVLDLAQPDRIAAGFILGAAIVGGRHWRFGRR